MYAQGAGACPRIGTNDEVLGTGSRKPRWMEPAADLLHRVQADHVALGVGENLSLKMLPPFDAAFAASLAQSSYMK